jgi:hypothetical protein
MFLEQQCLLLGTYVSIHHLVYATFTNLGPSDTGDTAATKETKIVD